MPRLRRLTLVRHAMPAVDASSPPSAWRLSDAGASAAASLDLLVGAGAIILSSPERKAQETLDLAGAAFASPVLIDARFREVDRVERVHDRFRDARAAWVAGRLDRRHTGWETPDAAAHRFHEGVMAHPAEHLIVGTHGMVLTAWLVAQGLIPAGEEAVAFWKNLAYPHVLQLNIPLQRVRAVLTDTAGRYVMIKRTRPGQAPYWTTPGGGVALADATPEDALHRELHEELGARAQLGEILFERQLDSTRTEVFYEAQLTAIDLATRNGLEYNDPSRGGYDVEFVSRDELPGHDLRPADLKDFLLRSSRG